MKYVRKIKLKKNFLNPLSYYTLPLFLIFFTDSIMAYTFPVIVEKSLNSNTQLGIIMALSSVVGFIWDWIVPQIFPNKKWRLMLIMAIGISIIFPILTGLGTQNYSFLLFTLASMIWGIYFELIAFSEQSFIVNEDSKENFSRDWGLFSNIWNITAFIGPIFGALLLSRSSLEFTITMVIIGLISLIFAILFLPKTDAPTIHKLRSKVDLSINFIREFKIIGILSERIYPIIIFNILVNYIIANIWTIGGLLGEEMSSERFPEWIILSLFSVALTLGGSLIVIFRVNRHKKRIAQITMIVGTLFLSMIYLTTNHFVIYLLIFIAGLSISLATPLNEAVFADLSNRNKNIELFLSGISRMTMSFAFIIGPLIIGFMSDKFGYKEALAINSIAVCILTIILTLITPRKLKLPQKALNTFDEQS